MYVYLDGIKNFTNEKQRHSLGNFTSMDKNKDRKNIIINPQWFRAVNLF